MKTPRVQDFDPHAKEMELGSPMDNLPSIQPPEKKPESLNTRKEESLKGRKEEFRQSGNQAIMNARKPEKRKVPKYSTQLKEELQTEVTVFAARHKMADYEVVQQAVEEYLERHT